MLRRSTSYLEGISNSGTDVSSASALSQQPSVESLGDRLPKQDGSENTSSSELRLAIVNSTDQLVAAAEKLDRKEEKTRLKERGGWDNKFQYTLAVVGYAVGLGNVWRFPYLVQKNGGGAFLIPYIIMLCLQGVPIFFLELAIGQRMRKGAIGAWNQMSPYMGGIGICSAAVSFIVGLYYNTIIAWCLYYLVLSFQPKLPWSECPEIPAGEYGNETKPINECKLSGASAYFWYRKTLNLSPSVDEGGRLNWWIIVSLFAAWTLVFLCIIKGIQSSGKVVYVTAIFPYIVLVIFFFRGVTLPGCENGLRHLFVPEFSRLADPQVWLDAATQILYSLGLGFGSLIALSSYNPPRNNCHKDAVLVALTNCGTSVFSGVVVFSILGFKATKTFEACRVARSSELLEIFNDSDVCPPPAGTPLNFTVSSEDLRFNGVTIMPNISECSFKEEIQKSASGTGLTFIAFSEAIIQFPAAPIWSILFFLMLLTIGLDSMFATLEGVVTPLVDLNIVKDLNKKPGILSAVLSLVSFLLSFSFANQAGGYIFALFDDYSGSLPLLFVVFFEVITVSFVYGLNKFSTDIEMMTGSRPNIYLLAMWHYVNPLVILVLILATFVKMSDVATYEAWDANKAENITRDWPSWCMFVAALLITLCVIWLPAIALLRWLKPSWWKKETPAYFPEQQIKTERKMTPYVPKRLEALLFYSREDLSYKAQRDERNDVFLYI